MSTSLELNPDVQCDHCGHFGAYELDGERLCPECYQLRGTCCQEFGGDDQWAEVELDAPSTPPGSDCRKPDVKEPSP